MSAQELLLETDTHRPTDLELVERDDGVAPELVEQFPQRAQRRRKSVCARRIEVVEDVVSDGQSARLDHQAARAAVAGTVFIPDFQLEVHR